MTLPATRLANGVARHFDVDDFRTFAASELDACAPWQGGVCFQPECGRVFQPTRRWQIYCCTDCERRGTAELRRIGHKAALALLAWRMGKYEQTDDSLRATSRAARRYVGNLQSAWWADRQARAEARGLTASAR